MPVLLAHAKLNLVLRVLAREDDGYHGLETVFCLLELADELRAEPRPGGAVTLAVHGDVDTGPPERNLAVRAAEAVLAATGRRTGIHLDLVKRIPAQAGLGGGSADAAAALLLANRLCGDAVPRHELLQLGAKLGADVPFLVAGAPLALAWGHGERLLRLPPLPAAPALLVIPPIPVPTPEAYRWVDEARQGLGRRGAVALDLDALTSWGSIGRLAANDFESPVFGRHAEVRAAFEALAATRPLVCRMSGSGSALFAVYRSERDRDDARDRLGKRHGATIATATRPAPPLPPSD
ncbi:MAG: 4-(cytidine 5'-diphospho)-2-C-methyl-D-erythritol kinase [Gemmatimonadales bacterium]|nr:4-(cytidine 5'-diphospho)-2-C-methyl-D-erythritol kinase [Gemmatimonadales bacterium]